MRELIELGHLLHTMKLLLLLTPTQQGYTNNNQA